MGNPFSRHLKTTLKPLRRTYGFNCLWSPANGGDAVNDLVFFNDPSHAERMANVAEFNQDADILEVYINQFPGLYESVRDGVREIVRIYEIKELPETGSDYLLAEVKKMNDGNTLFFRAKKL